MFKHEHDCDDCYGCRRMFRDGVKSVALKDSTLTLVELAQANKDLAAYRIVNERLRTSLVDELNKFDRLNTEYQMVKNVLAQLKINITVPPSN